MRQRNSLGLFVLLVILFAFACLGIIYGMTKWEEYATERTSISLQRQTDMELLASSCDNYSGFLGFLSCTYAAWDIGRKDYTAEEMLKAQQDMSIWSLGVLLASLATLFVSTFGVFFVWLTLKKADETNKAAVEAANAANEANRIMRREQRPWLTLEVLEGGEIEVDGDVVLERISFKVSNHGKSPAFYVKCSTTINWFGSTHDIRDKLKELCEVRPGLNYEGNCPTVFPSEEVVIAPAKRTVHYLQEERDHFLVMFTTILYYTASSAGASCAVETRAYNVVPLHREDMPKHAADFDEFTAWRVTV